MEKITTIKPYIIEVNEKDDSYQVEAVGYFIKDGIVVIEEEDGGRQLVKEFVCINIPKEWQDED